MKHMANSIWMSELRYGLQLTHKVRISEGDRKMKKTMRAKLRLLDGSRVKGKRGIKKMLEIFDFLSVNQKCCSNKATGSMESKQRPVFPILILRLRRGGKHAYQRTAL